jgi:hypothetical protein
MYGLPTGGTIVADIPEPSVFEGDPCASRSAMRYRLEVLDGTGGAVLAICANRTVALAAYYAALREHFGRGVMLRDRGDVVLSCAPRQLV